MEKQDTDEIVPGTVYLVDLQGISNAQKDANSKHNIVLVPQPSSNPNDPLRWSQTKKNSQFGFLWFWAFMQAVNVAWNGPVWTLWTTEIRGATYNTLNNTTAVNFLFLGLGCVFLQPTAMKLGRRFVYILCSVLAIVSNIIGSQASSISYLYVSGIISGFAAAPVDSLVEISTTDVFFQHERASYLSYVILALYAGTDLGPVACGYIVESMGWKWCFYFLIIFFSVLLIVQLFYSEDTTFERLNRGNQEEEILREVKSRESQSGAINIYDELKGTKSVVAELDDASIDESIPTRTYWQRMHLFEREYCDPRPWSTIFCRPVLLITFPAVIFGGYVYGSQMMWLSLMETTQSEFYSSPPYNFSDLTVGLTNLSALLGSIFGMFYGGQFVDWLTIKLSERNNGVFEPEYRLWAMPLPTLLNSAGLLAYGLGVVYEAHWFVSVGIGQFCLGFAMSSTGGITLTYVIDCYPKLASEALVLMLFLRNIIGMVFCFAIQPWLDRDGNALTTWLMFMLSVILNGSFVFFIWWGKDFRRWTANKYHKYCDPDFLFFK